MKFRLPVLIILLLTAFWLRMDRLDALPPGTSTDESTNAIDAFHISRNGYFPLYEDFGRPEPLHRLVLAIGAFAYGPSVWAFRLTTAFLGLLTVAATYWAARQCLIDLPPAQRQIGGLAATASLAVAIGHVTLSRAIYRGMLQPLPMLLFVGLILRGLRTGRRRDVVLSAVPLALALYTYTAALILPVALGAIGMSLLLFRRARWRAWFPDLLLAAAALLILLSPVIGLLITNPDAVLGRVTTVEGTTDNAPLPNLGVRIRLLIGQFFTEGDENPQYNTASAPLLPPVFNVLFAIGLLGLVVRFREVSSALIGALLVLAALPVILANEVTHGLRIVGEYVTFPLAIAVGVGVLLALVDRLLRVDRRREIQTAAVLGLIVLTGFDAAAAHRTYVTSWDENHRTDWRVYGLTLPHGEWFFRTDQRDLGRWLSEQDSPLLLPAAALEAPLLRPWLLTAYPAVRAVDAIPPLPDGTRLVIPWTLETGDLDRDARQFVLLADRAITLLPPLTGESHAVLVAAIDQATPITREGVIGLIGRVMPLPDSPLIAASRNNPTEPLAVFGGDMRLLGWRGPDTLDGNAARTVTFTLDWAAARRIGHDYHSFVQLWTQDGQAIAGTDLHIWRWLLPTSIWRTDDRVSVPSALDIPPDLPSGAYRLVTGLYVFVDDRLSAATPEGAPLGDVATVGWIKVPQRDAPEPGPPTLDARLDGVIALRAATITAQDDGTVRLALDWEALADRPALDATIFVHVVGPDGAMVAQDDQRPHGGQYPTFIWDAGEIVRTTHVLNLGGADPASLSVFVGMYTQPDFTRLGATLDGAPVPDDRIPLGTLADLPGG